VADVIRHEKCSVQCSGRTVGRKQRMMAMMKNRVTVDQAEGER